MNKKNIYIYIQRERERVLAIRSYQQIRNKSLYATFSTKKEKKNAISKINFHTYIENGILQFSLEYIETPLNNYSNF